MTGAKQPPSWRVDAHLDDAKVEEAAPIVQEQAQGVEEKEADGEPSAKGRKKKKMATVEAPSLADVLSGIEKQFGKDVVRDSFGPALRIPRIPTGQFPMDLRIAGGFPAGRYSLIVGKKGSGKSSIALKALAEWQRRCALCIEPDESCVCPHGPRKPWAAFIDLENDWDARWSDAMGVDRSRVKLVQPDYGEAAVDIVTGLIAAEELDFVVFNSIAQITPSPEMQKTALSPAMGVRAQLANRMLRVLAQRMVTKRRLGFMPTVICTNQIYVGTQGGKPGMPPPDVFPGGNNQLFAAAIVVRMAHVRYVHPGGNADDGGGKKDCPPLYAVQNFRVRYSKVSPPGVEGELRFILTPHDGMRVGDCDDRDLVVTQATRYGLIRKSEGAWRVLDLVAPTKDELVQMLLRDEGKFGRTKSTILKLMVEATLV